MQNDQKYEQMHFRECKPFLRFTLFSCADAGHVIYYSLRQNTSYVMRIFEKIHVLKCKNVILTLFVHFSYIVAHTFLYWSSLHTFATNSNRKKSIKFNIDLILSWKFDLLANSHNKSLKILTFSTFIFSSELNFLLPHLYKQWCVASLALDHYRCQPWNG